MDIPSNRRFLFVARKRLTHPFHFVPAQAGYFKRRSLAGTVKLPLDVFASYSPG